MPFTKKSAGLSRLNEVGRFYAMSQKEQDRYIKENFDDVVVIRDVMNLKMQEGRAEGRAEGHAEGLSEGLAKGRAEEKLAIACRLKAAGFDNDFIAQTAGLTPDEISNL